MRSFLVTLLFSLALAQDPASYVNLFIGTTNDGHVFPGQYPYGILNAHIVYVLRRNHPPWNAVVKVGMDTDSPDNVACSLIPS